MRIDILTLFPDMCNAVMQESIIGRAQAAGKVEIVCTNIRDFAGNKHNKVDDTPYGGGMGMIMAANPIYDCYKSLYNENEPKPHLVYLSPKGTTFNQQKAVEFSKLDRLVLLCGHYEGIDQRVIDEIVDEEISIGDFVLTGGELPLYQWLTPFVVCFQAFYLKTFASKKKAILMDFWNFRNTHALLCGTKRKFLKFCYPAIMQKLMIGAALNHLL